MNCPHCGHPLAWHDEYGICRPRVMIDASQCYGNVVAGRCTYGCVIPVDTDDLAHPEGATASWDYP